jgi:two-component system sensor histidine kinase RpfC
MRHSELPTPSRSELPADVVGPISARRILVADDNETNLLLLQEMLQKDGHRVVTCSSGMEAIELLAERDFDLLLLDYNLGDMDGVRVLQTYRFGRQHAAPALFLTADTTQLTASRLKAADAAGVLYKPISLAKLRNAIRDLETPAPVAASTATDSASVDDTPAKSSRPVLAAVSVHALDPETIEELKEVSSRPEFFPMLMTEAEHDMVRNSQLILDALTQMNHASLRDAAHALTGVSANVGAVRLLALATKLRTSPIDEIDASRERWAADLNDTLRLTVAALRKEVSDVGGHASGGGATTLHLR